MIGAAGNGIAFSGARLDRADQLRGNADELTRLMQSLSSRLLLLDGINPRSNVEGGLAWGSLADADAEAELVFLGLLDGAARFAAVPRADASVDMRPRSVWPLMATLPPDELALYGGARSVVDWHRRHGFCAACGQPTVIDKGGWMRRCAGCGTEHFPRVDPVVIMLVLHQDSVLVGRQHAFPPRVYSALAGFLEPGETLEESVTREVREEVGIDVADVRYIASQPWPFPSSLMIGCTAQAKDTAITLDREELDDARWITRDDARAALAGSPDAPIDVPPPHAIAHQLLRRWVDGDC